MAAWASEHSTNAQADDKHHDALRGSNQAFSKFVVEHDEQRLSVSIVDKWRSFHFAPALPSVTPLPPGLK